MEPLQVELRDGAPATIRQLGPDDRELIRRGFERLSAESRWRRFMTADAELSDDDLDYLVDVDHRRHEALIAVDPESGEGLGVARWFRKPGRREVAELAVAVLDDWQGRGLGSALVAAINERARAEGIERYEAVVSVDNEQVIEALERHGAVRRDPAEPGTVEFEAAVPGGGVGASLATGLRAAATGQLRLASAAAGWVRQRVPWPRS